jgi:hypothetical protein
MYNIKKYNYVYGGACHQRLLFAFLEMTYERRLVSNVKVTCDTAMEFKLIHKAIAEFLLLEAGDPFLG